MWRGWVTSPPRKLFFVPKMISLGAFFAAFRKQGQSIEALGHRFMVQSQNAALKNRGKIIFFKFMVKPKGGNCTITPLNTSLLLSSPVQISSDFNYPALPD